MTLSVYLDTSVYNRPFDNQKQARIWLETLAFSVILQMVENRDISLLNSSVLEYETSRNPHTHRRQWILQILNQAHEYILIDEQIRQKAKLLGKNNIKPLDALHIAIAESINCDYFVTCDDRLIRRYNQTQKNDLIVCNPTEFVRMTTGA